MSNLPPAAVADLGYLVLWATLALLRAAATLVVVVAMICILTDGWLDKLLDWEHGRWWPVPASVLPACIPIARSLEEEAPPWIKACTVGALLMAVAALQIYGQERNNRDRIKTAAERTQQEADREDQVAKQTDLLAKQTNLLIALSSEIRKQTRKWPRQS